MGSSRPGRAGEGAREAAGRASGDCAGGAVASGSGAWVPGLGSGSGARVLVLPAESSRWGAATAGRRLAGGRKSAGRAGPGHRGARREPSRSPQATTPSPASPRRGLPSATRKLEDYGGWLKRLRRTNERTDGEQRAGSARKQERAATAAGGRGETCAPPCAQRARAGPSRGPAHARALPAQPRLLRSVSTP